MTWLILALCALAFFFAYQTVNKSIKKQEQSLIANTQDIHNDIEKNLVTSNKYILEYTNLVSESSTASTKLLSTQNFSSVNAQLATGQILHVYGNALPAIPLSQVKSTHLANHKTAIVIGSKQNAQASLYLVNALPNLQGNLFAELNPEALLKPTEQSKRIYPILKNGSLYLIQSNKVISQNGLIQLANQSVRKQNGYANFSNNGINYRSYYTKLNMLNKYATEDWVIVDVQESKPFVAMLINTSQDSLLLFVCLLAIFCFSYLRVTFISKLNKSLEVTTILLKQKFNGHIESMSELNNAILAGTKFDEIIDISVQKVFESLPCLYAGVAKLSEIKNERAEVHLFEKNQNKSQQSVKVDKLTLNLLQSHLNGYLIDTPEDHAFFSALLNVKQVKMLMYPVFKEGSISAILFCAIPKSNTPSDFQLSCCKNIAQHLGIGYTSAFHSEKLYVKEYFDSVTELFNQQACRERLYQEMAAARRRKSKVAIFHISLIGYRKVNETFGYLMGDQLLKEAAKRLKTKLRGNDVIARLGSDDFIVITSDIDKVTNANRLADKVAELFSEPIAIFDHSFNVSTSIGISIYPNDGITVDEILNHANTAMIKAKKMGPSQHAFYEENLSSNELWRISLEKNLRAALENESLLIHYQPQFNPRSKKISGVEALIRWNHPDRGFIKPTEFIQIAEESGLIVMIGEFVRKTAFTQFMLWQRAGLNIPTVSVNISSYEMQRKEFVPDLKKLIAHVGISPKAIELEITESLILEISTTVMANFKELSEMGVRIAIDDFGTGYSNLSYLGRLPFDVLKIDKSFMHGIGTESNSNQIVTMMIDMAHHLGKSVCAEGVETKLQYDFLENAGCDTFQGFLLSKPISADDISTLMQTKTLEAA